MLIMHGMQHPTLVQIEPIVTPVVANKVEGPPRKIGVRRLMPQIVIIITRPAYKKARSIKHCYKLAAVLIFNLVGL
jgi:hypothetical protein